MTKPNFVTGGLVGLLLIAPLIVISALGNQIVGLPFAPFDLFPFVRDNTPGGLITLVIDTMVDSIIALNAGRVDVVAKVLEQIMAILMMVGVGVLAGAIYFGVMRRAVITSWFTPGLALGLVVGIPMAIISNQFGLSAQTGAPLLNAAWLLALFIAWGLAIAWAHDRLSNENATAPERANATR